MGKVNALTSEKQCIDRRRDAKETKSMLEQERDWKAERKSTEKRLRERLDLVT